MHRTATGTVPGKGAYPAILPALGRVPSAMGGLSNETELVIKATHTGILFLGGYDDYAKKIIPLGKYKKRYTGSKTCQVDINGNLYLCNKEYKEAVNNKKDNKGQKQKKRVAPRFLELPVVDSPSMEHEREQGAISTEFPECTNFAANIAKKDRKKSYVVNSSQVRQRIYGMLNSQKGKKHLYFWTVSFPEGTPDSACYKAFNTWLTSLRKYGMLKDYLWVAERQDGKRAPGKTPTNTLHFHIAIPHYMDVIKANAMMRGTLKNLAKAGAMPGAVCDAKTKQYHYLPSVARYNGVDICKHRKTKRVINFAIKKGSVALAHYITKYVTKNETAFDHLAWHNSRGFSALFTGVTFTLSEFAKHEFGHFLNRVRVFKMRFAVFIPWLYGPPPLLTDHLYKLNTYIQTVTENGNRKKPIHSP